MDDSSFISESFDSEDCKMKKLKSGDNDTHTMDRLSDLPDSLIFKILSCLEMRDVVRTTLLSKRWNNLWTTIPSLCFENKVNGNEEEIRNFINQALLLWKGTKIKKFEIRFWVYYQFDDESLYRDINLWWRFLMEKKVEELYLCLPCYDDRIGPLPHCIYECSSIRKLSLECRDVHIRGDVHWDQLKSLTIKCRSVSEDVINRVVSGAPQLEIFELSILLVSNKNLSIRSCSLKRLSIHKTSYQAIKGDRSMYAMLTMWAPNLETLTISGAQYSECLLMDVSSLTDVTLQFSDYWDVFLCGTLRQILPTFQHVEKLTLSSWCFEVLAAMIMKGEYSFSPLLNVKLLRLPCNPISLDKIVGLLEIFPKLKMLDTCESFLISSSMKPLTSEEHMIKNLLTQLRTVKIDWEVYDYVKPMFEFIEFFLKHAAVLERIVIQKIGRWDVESDDMVLAAEKELLSLQRSFPKVELIFCKKGW